MMIKINSLLLIVSIVFMHFMLARIAGFPLTIIPFTMSIFVLTHFELVKNLRTLSLFIILMIWPFIVYGIYVNAGGSVDLFDFSKTFLLWIYAFLTLIFASFSRLNKTPDYSVAFFVALILITLFSLAQILLVEIADSTLLYNLFGSYSYMGQQNLGGSGLASWGRSPGLYLEPSFNAFVMFFLTSILLINNKVNNAVLIFSIGICGVVLTTSAVGLLAMLGLITSFVIAKVIADGVKPIRILAVILIFLILVWGLSIYHNSFLSDKIYEVFRAGTSGYWRLIAPQVILTKVLVQYPFGVPFGQVENFIIPIGLNHAGNIGSSLDNGLFVLPFYFGWLGVFVILGLISKFLISVYQGDRNGVIFFWYLIVGLQFSGGVFLPEFIFCLVLMIFQYRKSLSNIYLWP